MARFFHPLILMLASLGKSELARQIQYRTPTQARTDACSAAEAAA